MDNFGVQKRNTHQIVKSPSDTTIYTPGLRRMSNEEVSLIEKISDFVESIRLDGKNRVSRIQRDLVDHQTKPSTSRDGRVVGTGDQVTSNNKNSYNIKG